MLSKMHNLISNKAGLWSLKSRKSFIDFKNDNTKTN